MLCFLCDYKWTQAIFSVNRVNKHTCFSIMYCCRTVNQVLNSLGSFQKSFCYNYIIISEICNYYIPFSKIVDLFCLPFHLCCFYCSMRFVQWSGLSCAQFKMQLKWNAKERFNYVNNYIEIFNLSSSTRLLEIWMIKSIIQLVNYVQNWIKSEKWQSKATICNIKPAYSNVIGMKGIRWGAITHLKQWKDSL